MKARALTAGFVLVIAVLAGCDQPADPPTSNPPTSQSSQTSEPTTDPTSDPTSDQATIAGPTDDPRVNAAVADLADRLDLDLDQIIVGQIEQVTWPDGALGCPSPGGSYTQAQVPGERLILTTSTGEYAYHASRSGDFFYCARPSGGATDLATG